tara:strand:- start:698 stop:973 length:276 start_codon:yes stop_codon:yes gene_type:complete
MALEHATGFVQPQASSDSVKQLHPEDLFQLPQAPGDSWLRNAEPVRSNRNTLGSRDFKETTQVSQPEVSIPIHNQNGISLAENINIQNHKS